MTQNPDKKFDPADYTVDTEIDLNTAGTIPVTATQNFDSWKSRKPKTSKTRTTIVTTIAILSIAAVVATGIFIVRVFG